jgi:dienelactone hydrolase
MVRLEFGLGLQYPVHAFIESGYAVFVPNTRGRSGQGEAFRRAIRDDRDYVHGGLGDVLSGLDHLVARGEIDPRRVGVAGFSYGAMLTAFAVTHSERFQAASLNDAQFDLRGFALKYAGNPEFRRFWNDNLGFSDPYDPDAARRMQAQSPLQAVARARAPTLMEAGVAAMGGMEDGVLGLFQGFRRFGAPAEFVRYPRTGHGVQEPRLRFDSARRNLEWFDHWLGLRASSRLSKRFGPIERAPDGAASHLGCAGTKWRCRSGGRRREPPDPLPEHRRGAAPGAHARTHRHGWPVGGARTAQRYAVGHYPYARPVDGAGAATAATRGGRAAAVGA